MTQEQQIEKALSELCHCPCCTRKRENLKRIFGKSLAWIGELSKKLDKNPRSTLGIT